MLTELDKLKNVFKELGIPFVTREEGEVTYLFKGEPSDAADLKWMDDNFETTALDDLTRRNNCFEFENGLLTGH